MTYFAIYSLAKQMVAGIVPYEPNFLKFRSLTYRYMGQIVNFNHILNSEGMVIGFEIDQPLERKSSVVLRHTARKMRNVHADGGCFQILLAEATEGYESDCDMSIGGKIYMADARRQPIIVLPDYVSARSARHRAG